MKPILNVSYCTVILSAALYSVYAGPTVFQEEDGAYQDPLVAVIVPDRGRSAHYRYTGEDSTDGRPSDDGGSADYRDAGEDSTVRRASKDGKSAHYRYTGEDYTDRTPSDDGDSADYRDAGEDYEDERPSDDGVSADYRDAGEDSTDGRPSDDGGSADYRDAGEDSTDRRSSEDGDSVDYRDAGEDSTDERPSDNGGSADYRDAGKDSTDGRPSPLSNFLPTVERFIGKALLKGAASIARETFDRITSPRSASFDHTPLENNRNVSISSNSSSNSTENSSSNTSSSRSSLPKCRVRPDKLECGVAPPRHPQDLSGLVRPKRIVNGTTSPKGQWPWVVSIYVEDSLQRVTNSCGGALINRDIVMTCAHCFFNQDTNLFVNKDKLLVRLGSNLNPSDHYTYPEESNGTVSKVREMIVHPHYNTKTYENDIALLLLENPEVYQRKFMPICLPRVDEKSHVGETGVVVGWGLLSEKKGYPKYLQETEVQIVSGRQCEEWYNKVHREVKIDKAFVCAGYVEGFTDACQGDSGGPLMVQDDCDRWTVVGIVSKGYRCAQRHSPGVYVNVTNYRSWIELMYLKLTQLRSPDLQLSPPVAVNASRE